MNIELTTRNPSAAVRLQILRDGDRERHPTDSKKYLTVRIKKEIKNAYALVVFVRSVAQQARQEKITDLSIIFSEVVDIFCEFRRDMLIEIFSRELVLGHYQFDRYRTTKSTVLETITLVGDFTLEEKKQVRAMATIARGTNVARDLANTPSRDMGPSELAQQATKVAEQSDKTTVEVLDTEQCQKMGMGLFIAVSRGSARPGQFIILEYRGTNKSQPPVVLIGKGVCFDTGGLNMKPTGGIEGMHHDMARGTACLGTLQIVQNLGLKINLVVIIPAVDNMVSGSSYAPGDIVTSLSGQTVFVGNTDAEGRLILADALTYAERFKPQLIIDVAILTGSALAGLGKQASAGFSNNNTLLQETRTIGERVANRVWPMPLYDEYSELLENDFADLNNIGPEKWGDCCVAASFLQQFVPTNVDWLHIDMAPREISNAKDGLSPGATGEPVVLLVELIKSRVK